jgi:hypothetical protein
VEDDHELAWWPEVIEKAAGGVVSGLRRREGGKEMNGGARCQRWSGSNFATSATEVLRIATARVQLTARGRSAYVRTISYMLSGCSVGAR